MADLQLTSSASLPLVVSFGPSLFLPSVSFCPLVCAPWPSVGPSVFPALSGLHFVSKPPFAHALFAYALPPPTSSLCSLLHVSVPQSASSILLLLIN